MSSKKFINKIDYFTTFFYMSMVGGGDLNPGCLSLKH